MKNSWICTFFTYGLLIYFSVTVNASEEHNLITKLMTDYATVNAQVARPVDSFSDKLNVSFGIGLIKADVNTMTKRLTASVWFRYTWADTFLKWDAGSYNGLDAVRLSMNNLWSPDIFLFNGFGHMDVNTDALAIAYSSGKVLWVPPATIQVDCTLDGEIYSCPMKFGSWTYSGRLINLMVYAGMEGFDTADYLISNTFELVNTSSNKTTKYYECCSDEPYEDITFHLKLKSSSNSGASGLCSLLPLIALLIPPPASSPPTRFPPYLHIVIVDLNLHS